MFNFFTRSHVPIVGPFTISQTPSGSWKIYGRIYPTSAPAPAYSSGFFTKRLAEDFFQTYRDLFHVWNTGPRPGLRVVFEPDLIPTTIVGYTNTSYLCRNKPGSTRRHIPFGTVYHLTL